MQKLFYCELVCVWKCDHLVLKHCSPLCSLLKNNVAVCVYQYVHLNVRNLYWDSSSVIKLPV